MLLKGNFDLCDFNLANNFNSAFLLFHKNSLVFYFTVLFLSKRCQLSARVFNLFDMIVSSKMIKIMPEVLF